MEIIEAKKIVKDFNEKNRFRDCGKLNDAIDTVLKALDNKDEVYAINIPARNGKTIDVALKFYKALYKLPLNKLCGISRIENGSFTVTIQECILKDTVKKLLNEYIVKYHNYLDGMERKLSHLQDEHKIRATYAEFGVLKGKTEILQELLKEE